MCRGGVVFGKKHMSIPMERPAPGSYEHDGDFQQLEGPYFGRYGGQWMPESLMAALQEVAETFRKAIKDPEVIAELNDLNTNYINRPSLLTEAPRFAPDPPAVSIFLTREHLLHTCSQRLST